MKKLTNKTQVGLLLVALFFSLNLCGAEEPAPPYVRLPSAGSSWQVTVANPNGPKTDKKGVPIKPPEDEIAAPVAVLLSMKSGINGVTSGAISYSDGRREEFYVAKGNLMLQSANSKKIMLRNAQTSANDPLSLRVEFFPGIGWINKATYVDKVKKEDVECLHFFYTETVGDPPLPGIKLEAWIRASDRHPLEVRAGDIVYRFSEITPSKENVPLPADFESVVEKRQVEQTALDLIRQSNEKQARSR